MGDCPWGRKELDTRLKRLSTQHKIETHMGLLWLMPEPQFIPVTWVKFKSWKLGILTEKLGDLTEFRESWGWRRPMSRAGEDAHRRGTS